MWRVVIFDYSRDIYIYTLERNRNATLFQWKIHVVLFKVLD